MYIDCETLVGDEVAGKAAGLMKTGVWGELTGFMMSVVSVLGWIRLELKAGGYMAY